MGETRVRRAQLEARLAAERANLHYQLRGLDEQALCHEDIVTGWTARDLFPHLGYWDAWTTERIQLVLNDRRDEIKWLNDPEDVDQMNREMRQLTAQQSLRDALAISLKERYAFLVTLSQTPDDLLFQRIQIRPGWRTSIYTWARDRYRHDAAHAADIQRWRRTRGKPAKGASFSRLILRPLLSASRQEFMSMSQLVPPDARNKLPVKGAWTLQDVLGLISVYEYMGVTALKDLSKGRSPEISKTIRNFETFNEAQVVAKRGTGWNEMLEEYRLVRRGLTMFLDQLTDEDLMRPFVAPWGAPITAYQYIFGLAIHEQEQAAALRRALHLRPLPARLRHYRPNQA